MPDQSTLEIEQSLVGHFIGEIPEDFDKPVAYVLQRDGLWERRTNPLGTFCRRLAEAHVPGLPVVLREGYELNVPRMPTSVLWEAIAFFREIYFSMRTESMVRVIYNRERGGYETECPKQIVAPAAVVFEKHPLPKHKLLVAEIHSHAGFGAGFSGTDDADELGDRFYGVVGKLREALPEVAFRLSIGGEKVRIPLGALFALEEDSVFSCSFPKSWLKQVYARPRKGALVKGIPDGGEQLRMMLDEAVEEDDWELEKAIEEEGWTEEME